ncbi:Zinc finger protein PLAG1 [Fusarium austroafricanum]|uniref:Zinc finger protein PLAG1 n=1 Tax=Fusarium austroafricanum TaxID=2364996 RepID=A0A8H4KKB7_9HYPO|nr:Zinc finger protein PLAG1 [Fusarium austroafricanum]
MTDPSLIHPELTRPPMGIPPYDNHFQQTNPNPTYPTSPSASSSSPQPHMMRTNSSSPFLQPSNFQSTFPSSPYGAPMDTQNHIRAPSISQFVPPTPGEYSSDESKEKQRCTYPECGKTFKDLKAHMLTHQNERPEKCPIQTCEYHTKGFARKYDKNRHTLTHYKGTMVCGFCPGSGSAAEKSFNRADVFKRHLTSVHGVEQTPPNSRKKSSAGANSTKKLSGYAPDATGKCSTCSQTFSNAQDFYEHLDDCVLRIVQQEDPAEAINAKRLAEVENDKDVHQTLEKNNLPTTTDTVMANNDDEYADSGDDDDDSSPKSNPSPATKKKGNPANGVQKSRGVTHSRGGVTLGTKPRSRKNRRDYPSSWGFDKGQMTMKKRVMAVFDGPRRLAKDDMMLSTEHEVRIKLSDGKSYVTDLDVQTLKRAAGFHGATEEEKGPWISDDPTPEQLKEMQQMLANNTTTTTL